MRAVRVDEDHEQFLIGQRVRAVQLEPGTVQRSDMQDLLQQVESVKRLAQLLSRRSDVSRRASNGR